jgi:predicted ATPase
MEGIGFKNMKVLEEEQWFDFKNITLLTGTNNSGKSSIINAMQMLQENIKGKTTDELLRSEFKVKANQNKYGSIENFVNNKLKEGGNYFGFIRRLNNLEYKFKVEIRKELESYGSITQLKAHDIKTKDIAFFLNVLNPYPDFQCEFMINYKYFVDRFFEKCKNTELLFQRKLELDELLSQVKSKVKSIDDLKELANKIGDEVSVYIVVSEDTSYHVDIDEEKSEVSYIITENEEMVEAFYDDYQKLDEVKVFFSKSPFGILNQSSFIKEKDYRNSFAKTYEHGLFNFTQLWIDNPVHKIEFEEIVTSYYKTNLDDSCRLLCDDLLTVLSSTVWNMRSSYESDPMFQSIFMINFFLEALPDFGLIASRLVYDHGDRKMNVVASHGIHAESHLINNFEPLDKLISSNFFESVYDRLAEILHETYKEDNHFAKRKQIIDQTVYDKIYSEIKQKVLDVNIKLNNIYVSSNRFAVKRSFSFNDNNDFTNLINIIESLDQKSREMCHSFINKWIKEFDLAEELVLIPDSETGNFKAYLRNGNLNTPIADYGLGTNQILPIIFSLGFSGEELPTGVTIPRTVVIEEPEANLHPALQSKLADMFVEANRKFNVKIIAETHSEYLIRKLQYLVATPKSEASSDDVVIYYFYKPTHPDVIDRKVKQVEKIDIDKSGRLSKNFGNGFFDEADNIAINLFLLNKDQAN